MRPNGQRIDRPEQSCWRWTKEVDFISSSTFDGVVSRGDFLLTCNPVDSDGTLMRKVSDVDLFLGPLSCRSCLFVCLSIEREEASDLIGLLLTEHLPTSSASLLNSPPYLMTISTHDTRFSPHIAAPRREDCRS